MGGAQAACVSYVACELLWVYRGDAGACETVDVVVAGLDGAVVATAALDNDGADSQIIPGDAEANEYTLTLSCADDPPLTDAISFRVSTETVENDGAATKVVPGDAEVNEYTLTAACSDDASVADSRAFVVSYTPAPTAAPSTAAPSTAAPTTPGPPRRRRADDGRADDGAAERRAGSRAERRAGSRADGRRRVAHREAHRRADSRALRGRRRRRRPPTTAAPSAPPTPAPSAAPSAAPTRATVAIAVALAVEAPAGDYEDGAAYCADYYAHGVDAVEEAVVYDYIAAANPAASDTIATFSSVCDAGDASARRRRAADANATLGADFSLEFDMYAENLAAAGATVHAVAAALGAYFDNKIAAGEWSSDRVVVAFDDATDMASRSAGVRFPARTSSTSRRRGAACYWANSNEVVADAAAAPDLYPGDDVTLLPGVLRRRCDGFRCECDRPANASSAVVEAPSPPLAVRAILQGPTTVSDCEAVELDASLSTGSGGRAFAYAWVVVDADGAAVLGNATDRANAGGASPTLLIEAHELAGSRAASADSASPSSPRTSGRRRRRSPSRSRSAATRRRACPSSAAAQTTALSATLSVKGEAIATSCDGRPVVDRAVVYAWRLYDAASRLVDVASTSNDPRFFKLAARR
ncbi:hypothetical protein JL720_312 [Aureococcus anophagefferens]|nr:hypothetical protein JL720_312 [Aureococcus anophagefferens]